MRTQIQKLVITYEDEILGTKTARLSYKVIRHGRISTDVRIRRYLRIYSMASVLGMMQVRGSMYWLNTGPISFNQDLNFKWLMAFNKDA